MKLILTCHFPVMPFSSLQLLLGHSPRQKRSVRHLSLLRRG